MGYPTLTNNFSKQKKNYVVLGAFRSGTSVTAQALSKLGVDFGPKKALIGPGLYNPSGHFQRYDILHANDKFIESSGSSLEAPSDPWILLRKGDEKIFKRMDLAWIEQTGTTGLKDPRFCATLLAWLELGLLDRTKTKLVYITRNPESVIQSAEKYPSVAKLARYSKDDVGPFILRYIKLAQWNAEHLDLPMLHIHFEDLLSEPEKIILQLGEFIGCKDVKKIRTAINSVGKQKAKMRFLIHHPIRYITRYTISKLWHFINREKRRVYLDHFFRL